MLLGGGGGVDLVWVCGVVYGEVVCGVVGWKKCVGVVVGCGG